MKRDEIPASENNATCDIHPSSTSPTIEEPDLPPAGADNDVQSLMRNYQAFLMGRCRMLTQGDRHDANDLFSRVMLKVCSEGAEQLQHVRHKGGWLSRIAYNQFIDDQRERQADARRDDGLSYLSETIGPTARSPEQHYLNNELNQHLGLAFESLPMRLRRVAYMRFCEEAPYAEIAADLDISLASARKHIQEARRLLGARVRGYVDDAAAPAPRQHPDHPAAQATISPAGRSKP